MVVFKQIPDELDNFQGDIVVAVIGEDERPLRATNSWLDWRLYGSISELLLRGYFTGKLGEKCLLPTYGKFHFDRIVLLGGGELFLDPILPNHEDGQRRWHEIGDLIHEVVESLKLQQIGLSLPRFDGADYERALLKSLKSSHLPAETSLFLSRSPYYSTILPS